jgi:methionyl-tRNA formyltransferase
VHGDRLKLGPVTLRPERGDLSPGSVDIGKRAVLVGTATSAVELGEVQAQGKPRMAAADWARGLREPVEALG